MKTSFILVLLVVTFTGAMFTPLTKSEIIHVPKCNRSCGLPSFDSIQECCQFQGHKSGYCHGHDALCDTGTDTSAMSTSVGFGEMTRLPECDRSCGRPTYYDIQWCCQDHGYKYGHCNKREATCG